MEFFEQFRNLDVQAIRQQAEAIWAAGPQLVMIAGAFVGLVFVIFLGFSILVISSF